MPSELLTVQEAARWAKLSESFLNKARLAGTGPKYIRLGNAIRYRQEDLDAWAATAAASSTSEYRDSGPSE
jgi:predicted DNA-binding transcriptional regulator AlpA